MLPTIYILYSAWAVLAGLILSLFDRLDAVGYAIALAVGILIGGVILKRLGPPPPVAGWRRIFRRGWRRLWIWRRPLPLIFGIYLLIAFVGGAIYAPTNYDFLTYRFSRMLHWWAEGHWHWIHTLNGRMNYSGTTSEWGLMPLFVFSMSDRLFFLQNALAYALFPGALFVMFRGLGVGRKLSWWLIWLTPTGFCYALQAGSVGNDLIGTVFFIWAVGHFLNWRRMPTTRDFIFGCLCCALMTGTKASNVPLIFPLIGIITTGLWSMKNKFNLKPRLSTTALSILLILVLSAISFLPVAAQNLVKTGSFTGEPDNRGRLAIVKPLAGLVGHPLQLMVNTLNPPFLIRAKEINANLIDPLVDNTQFGRWIQEGFLRFRPQLSELPIEEGAGLGLGIFIVCMITMVLRWIKTFVPQEDQNQKLKRAFFLLSLASIVMFMSKLGSEAGPRLLAPYYPIFIGIFFLDQFCKTLPSYASWRYTAVFSAVLIAPSLLLTPARPMLSAESVKYIAPAFNLPISTLNRLESVYNVYRQRNDVLGIVRDSLLPQCRNIGLISSDDIPEIGLWRPLGSRRVRHLIPDKKINCSKVLDQLDSIVVNTGVFSNYKTFVVQNGFHIIAKLSVSVKASKPPEEYVAAVRKASD